MPARSLGQSRPLVVQSVGYWRSALLVVKPETVIAWHRKGFGLFWTWKVRHGQPGRPSIPKDVRDLIRRMSRANPTWGTPRIHGGLLKLGMNISETSVSKYMVRHQKPPTQTWRTFLENHVKDWYRWTSSRFRLSASKFSTYSWCWLTTGAGSSTSASPPTPPQNGPPSNFATPFPGTARHAIFYGIATASSATTSASRSRIWASMELLSAPRSPWQRAYVERVIGTIRRECLDHVIVSNEASLSRHVKSFMIYYHESRTHLSLGKDSPESRAVLTPELGRIIAIPQAGGLHHRHERRAA
jgi:putative transposase